MLKMNNKNQDLNILQICIKQNTTRFAIKQEFLLHNKVRDVYAAVENKIINYHIALI